MPSPVSHLITRSVDRLILSPSRHEISVDDRVVERVPLAAGELELWHRSGNAAGAEKTKPAILAFPGTGSRAEDSVSLVDLAAQSSALDVWWVNPPGYGRSGGVARLQNITAMAETALATVRDKVADRPIMVEGFSLGCVAALYLSATQAVDGLLLRNPPALREILQLRSGWWSLGLIPRMLSLGLPPEIDSIRNAERSRVPAVFVTAMKDRIVPASIQYRIVDAYAGPHRVLAQPSGDHTTALSETEVEQLKIETAWLRKHVRRRRRDPGAAFDA